MKSMRTLLTAVVAASVIFAFAGTASARITGMYFTCNIDGFHHCEVTHEDGTVQEYVCSSRCGPGSKWTYPNGEGVKIVVSEKRQISSTGEKFLKVLEKEEGMLALKLSPVKGTPPKRSERSETIYLAPADVRHTLAACLSKIDPDWKKETSPKEKK